MSNKYYILNSIIAIDKSKIKDGDTDDTKKIILSKRNHLSIDTKLYSGYLNLCYKMQKPIKIEHENSTSIYFVISIKDDINQYEATIKEVDS